MHVLGASLNGLLLSCVILVHHANGYAFSFTSITNYSMFAHNKMNWSLHTTLCSFGGHQPNYQARDTRIRPLESTRWQDRSVCSYQPPTSARWLQHKRNYIHRWTSRNTRCNWRKHCSSSLRTHLHPLQHWYQWPQLPCIWRGKKKYICFQHKRRQKPRNECLTLHACNHTAKRICKANKNPSKGMQQLFWCDIGWHVPSTPT